MATKETRYTGVRLPPDVKRRVRILAAAEGVSTAVMTARLIEFGIPVYEGGANLDTTALQALETAEGMAQARGEQG